MGEDCSGRRILGSRTWRSLYKVRTPYMDVICIQSGGRVDFAISIVQYMISALVPGMISAFMPGDQTSLHVPLVRAI